MGEVNTHGARGGAWRGMLPFFCGVVTGAMLVVTAILQKDGADAAATATALAGGVIAYMGIALSNNQNPDGVS